MATIERVASEHAHAEATKRARVAAVAIFEWVASAEARELRACARHARLDRVPLTPWMRSNGVGYSGPFSGAWRVSIVDDRAALFVERVGCIAAGGLGRLDHRIGRAREFAEIVAPLVVLRVAGDVSRGRVLQHAARALRV